MSYTTIIPNWADHSCTYDWSWAYGAPTGNINGSTSILRSLSLASTKSGTNVLDWKTKIAKGLSASSAYSRSGAFLVSSEPGDARFTATRTVNANPIPLPPLYIEKPAWERLSGFATAMTIPGHLTVSMAKAEAAALTETYKKVLQAQRHLNGSAVVAEMVETLSMFGHPFKAIVGLSHRHLNRLTKERRRLRGPIKRQKEDWADIVSSTYLEYAFGLAPLINDTKDAAEALARWNFEGQEEILAPKAKAVGRGVDVSSSSADSVFKANDPIRYLWFHRFSKKTTEARAQYVVGLSATLQADFQSNERLIQLLGLSPSDWIPGIYEGIPWSWLLDYFTNVGDILNAMCASTADVKWISKTLVTRTQENTNVDTYDARLPYLASEGNHGASYHGHGGRFSIVNLTMQRTVPPTLGIPPLVLSIPSRAKQYLNMAAVLMQRRKKVRSAWAFPT